MPCHVPVANFPLLIGTVTLAPMRADLMCAYCKLIVGQPLSYPYHSSHGVIIRRVIASLQAYHLALQRYVCTDCPSCPPARSCPMHHSYPPEPLSPSFHSSTTRRMCAAQRD